jgi:hypothetical protein
MTQSSSSHDTAEFSHEEILSRLEMGRLEVQTTEDGSKLVVRDPKSPHTDRRAAESARPADLERRKRSPMQIPTLFPEKGPIGLLVVGCFADDAALKRPLPFWGDDPAGGHLVWEALRRAGLLHKRDEEFTLGRGGFWDENPPRTQGVAMTYCGYAPDGETLSFDRATSAWNSNRLQTLIQGSFERSMSRLKLVAIGEPARFMACACAYGIPDLTVLSIPAPEPESLDDMDLGAFSAAQYWVDWAADLLVIGRT